MKNYLFIFIAAFAALVGSAQSFDETDLVGTWKVTSVTGNANVYIKSFDTLILNDYVFENYGTRYLSGMMTGMSFVATDEHGKEDDWAYVQDYFISNNNKLHIKIDDVVDAPFLRFIINKLTKTEMDLTAFPSQARLKLTRVDDAEVTAIDADKVEISALYDLQGRQVERPHAGEIYIQGGQKIVAK